MAPRAAECVGAATEAVFGTAEVVGTGGGGRAAVSADNGGGGGGGAAKEGHGEDDGTNFEHC